MKTLIALSAEASFAAAIRVMIPPEDWKVIHHQTPWDAGLLSIPGSVDAVVVECTQIDVSSIRVLEALKKMQPGISPIVVSDEARQEWIEAAYLAGAACLLTNPLRQKLLQLMLDRALPPSKGNLVFQPKPEEQRVFPVETAARESASSVSLTLSTLRDLSRVLTHGLMSEALPKRFLELLREVLGVNRAAIFLRKPFPAVQSREREPSASRLHAASAVGVDSDLLNYFELSVDGGIGEHLHRTGRILKIDGSDVREAREIQKEFELLGMRVAIPILDRGTLIGVAVFDERITGERFSNSELALLFHALEELGLAVKNSWLHHEITRNHDLMTEILDALTGGCVVVAQDLQVTHCNPAARRFLLGTTNGHAKSLEFSDFPQELGSRIFESLKTGVAVAAFRHRPKDHQETSFHVSIIPFRGMQDGLPAATLILIDDFTQFQRSQQLEIEASNLRLVRSMAEHLSHEIGNALVPMSTHQQLFGEKYHDQEFRGSLSQALIQGIKRISRLSSQLLFLTKDDIPRCEPIAALQLIEDAFSDAQTLYGLDGRSLEVDNRGGPLVFDGNRPSLLHALSETFLNALQSSPPDSAVKIEIKLENESDKVWARVKILDKGPGFTNELAAKAANPFFSTRTVGPGLGLTVAKKIIESHHGRLQLVAGHAKGEVDILLPIKEKSPGSKFAAGVSGASFTPGVN